MQVVSTVRPIKSVVNVKYRYMDRTLIPLYCWITQKKLSFAWLTVIAPPPMVRTSSAFSKDWSRPIAGSKGANIDEVITIEAVEEPCAVFKAAANRKAMGKSARVENRQV